MKKLMQFELDKLLSNKFYYICSCISLLIIVILTATTKGLQSLLAEEGALFAGNPGDFCVSGLNNASFYLISGIFVAIYLCDDISQNTIKNIYAKGFTRTEVYFSKYIISLFAIIVLAILDFIVSYLAGCYLFSTSGFLTKQALASIAAQFAAVFAYHALYFAITTQFQKTGSSIALNILGPMLVSLVLSMIASFVKTDFNINRLWIEGLWDHLMSAKDKELFLDALGLIIYGLAFIGLGYYLNTRKEY